MGLARNAASVLLGAKSWYDASTYGAVVDGVTDDTTAVQNAVNAAYTAGGGTVLIPFIGTGTCIVYGLRLKSNVRLRLGAGVKLQRKAATTGNFIVNDAVTAVATSSDGAITSGAAILTTSLAAQAVVGQTVVIGTRAAATTNGAATGGGLLVANIISKTGTTVTLDRNAGTTTTVADVALFNRTKNFGIDFEPGSSIECGTGGGSGTGLHHIFLRHFDGFSTSGRAVINSSGSKYCLAPGDGTDVFIPWIGGTAASIVLQFDGPMKRVTIGVSDTISTDDGLAFTASSGSFFTYNETEGPITDVEVDTVLSTSTTSGFKLTSASERGTYLRRIHVGSVYQFGSTQRAVAMSHDTGLLDIDSITVDRTFGSVGTEAGTITNLTIGHLTPNAAAAGSSVQFDVTDTTIAKLHLKGASYNNPALLVHLLRLGGTAAITDVIMDGIEWQAAASSLVYSHSAAGVAVTTLRIINSHVTGAAGSGNLISTASGGTLARAFVVASHLTDMGYIADLASTTDVYLHGVAASGTGAGGIFARATGVVTVYGTGISIAGANGVTAGGTITSKTADFPLDVTQSYALYTVDNAVRDALLAALLDEDTTHVLTRSRKGQMSNQTPITGNLLIVYFTPAKTLTISKMGMASGNLSSGNTLIRLGLYTVDAGDSLALVAAIANDTALLQANNTFYERALSTGGSLPATYQLRTGVRMACGLLVVGGTIGNVAGTTGNNGWAAGATGGRKTGGTYAGGGLTDLPTTAAGASINASASGMLIELAA